MTETKTYPAGTITEAQHNLGVMGLLPHNCPQAFDLLEFSNSWRSEAKYYCRAGTITELDVVAELVLLLKHGS